MAKGIVTTLFVTTFATIILLGATANAADKAFRKCASCHSIEEGAGNKVGPNLWNIMNRGTAQSEGFKYSKKFAAWAEENPMWTPELMDAWLTNSKKLVKGTKMNFKERKEAKRADIIQYLQSMGEAAEQRYG